MLGEFSIMLLHDELCCTVQIARTRVVAEAAPVRQYGIFADGSECGNGGEAGYETVVIGDDGGDLGLLQHYFG